MRRSASTVLFRAVFLATSVVIGIGASGCRSAVGTICDTKCDCEGCSNREYNECIDDVERDERRAVNRRCADEFDEWVACVDDTATCRGRDYDDRCGPERRDLRDCMD
ncbi:hypothetical protein [Chondromyces crocatus]|nr:hypothetical protein [Chondromyces crocatus]